MVAKYGGAPQKAPQKQPRRFIGFVHLLARFYMNYHAAVLRAAKRKKNRAVDIDVHHSKENTLWALHWPRVGQNHLHDPEKKIKRRTLIADLTDAEIARLEGPAGQHTHRLEELLMLCWANGVRAEPELKVEVSEFELNRLLNIEQIKKMNESHLIQFKTLAVKKGCLDRLRVAKQAGGETLLTFTGYRGPGISKSAATGIVDYYRGKPKWTK